MNSSVPTFESLEGWRVVLVSPQNAENVGAAARVMKNFGSVDLAVVSPRCEIDPKGRAGALACWSEDVLENRTEHESLNAALGDCHYSIALTMLESEDRPVDFHGLVPASLVRDVPRNVKRALVFGREDHGLTNEECSLCSARWVIPTNLAAPSLNLAQAIAIALTGVAEATRLTYDNNTAAAEIKETATQRDIDGLFDHLEKVLVAAKYERGVPIEQTMRLLRRTALRSQLRMNELRTIRGIFRRILNEIVGYERR